MNTLPPSPQPQLGSTASSSSAGRRRSRYLWSAASLAALALAVSACGQDPGPGAQPPSSDPTAAENPASAEQRASRTEVASISPRVVLSHDGGLLTLDAETGATVHEEDLRGFLRLNNAGDGQHVVVTHGNRFEVYNSGIDAQGHGDHFHYYESDPGLSGIGFAAPHAGHVVVHNGLTTLFGDGDGSIQTFTSEHLKDGQPRIERTASDSPHHGVALRLADGTLLTTQGTEEARDTVQVKDGGDTAAETSDCPGVHGEAAAAPNKNGDVVVLGCENGPVVYRDGAFHKVRTERDYQRNGNLAGSEESHIVLADMKVDADAEQERPTQVVLIDSLSDSQKTVELGSSYWFRSLARGPEGEALVLTYDGKLNVIDEETGKVTAAIPAIGAWEEKSEWQQPGPILKAADGMAYITDAENKKLVVVDLAAGEVVNEMDLGVVPVEMAVVTGHPEAPEGADESHGAHGHDDES